MNPKLVILSIYDGGYCASILEDDKVTNLEDTENCAKFKLKHGKYPWEITLDELRKHYPEGSVVIICEDGTIQK